MPGASQTTEFEKPSSVARGRTSRLHPLVIKVKIICHASGRVMNLQVACLDQHSSKYAAYLQSKAGEQHLESASGLSLPTGTSLMGLLQYGRQLYDLVLKTLKIAVGRLSSQALQDVSNCWITVAKKHSRKMAGFTAQAARLPACNFNNYVEPPLIGGVRLLHVIVTTPDRFNTCYHKQASVQYFASTESWTGARPA
ncbi:hypothetical protein WJX77_007985 [Trebouxia sp. C0004]